MPVLTIKLIIGFNVHGESLFYIQELKARADLPQPRRSAAMAAFGRGYNSFHGFDTGPPPPVSSFPPFPGQYPSFQGFPSFPAFTGSAAAPAPVLVGAPPPSYPCTYL